MTRWWRAHAVPGAAHAVVDAGVRPAAGGRQCGDLRRLRRLSCVAISIGRCARSPPPSWHPPPTAPASTCTSCPRRRSPRASSPTSSCRSSTPTAPVRLASPAMRDLPRAGGPDDGAGRHRGSGAARVPRRRRASRPRRRASRGDRRRSATPSWSASSVMASTRISLGWHGCSRRVAGGSRDDRRARLLAGVARAGAGRRDLPARRADRPGRIRRPAGSAGPAGRSRRDDAVAQRGARSAARRARSTSPLRLRRVARAARADHRDDRRDRRRADAPSHRGGVSRHAAGGRRAPGGADGSLRRPHAARPRAGGCAGDGIARGAGAAATAAERRRLAGAAAGRDIRIEARELPDLVAYADPRLLAECWTTFSPTRCTTTGMAA